MYENKTIEEVCRQFECNGRTGLTQEEAGNRLEHYGKNMLREAKKKTLAQRFAEQLCDSLILSCLRRREFPLCFMSTVTL